MLLVEAYCRSSTKGKKLSFSLGPREISRDPREISRDFPRGLPGYEKKLEPLLINQNLNKSTPLD
jgi:hypothetical protein